MAEEIAEDTAFNAPTLTAIYEGRLLEIAAPEWQKVIQNKWENVRIPRLAALLVVRKSFALVDVEKILPESIDDIIEFCRARRSPLSFSAPELPKKTIERLLGNDIDMQNDLITKYSCAIKFLYFVHAKAPENFIRYSKDMFRGEYFKYSTFATLVDDEFKQKLEMFQSRISQDGFIDDKGDQMAEEFTGRLLGKGAFGEVRYSKDRKNGMEIAVKKLRLALGGNDSEKDYITAMNHAEIYTHWQIHERLIELKTKDITKYHEFMRTSVICTRISINKAKTEAYCQLPYITSGDLFSCLRKMADKWTVQWIPRKIQILRGLTWYLSAAQLAMGPAVSILNYMGLNHKDLAARNILVDAITPRVSDFGLSGENKDNTDSWVSTTLEAAVSSKSCDSLSVIDEILESFGAGLTVEAVSQLEAIRNSIFDGAVLPLSNFLADQSLLIWTPKEILRWMDPVIRDQCVLGDHVNWRTVHQKFYMEFVSVEFYMKNNIETRTPYDLGYVEICRRALFAEETLADMRRQLSIWSDQLEEVRNKMKSV